jgi:hypothetical protein
LSETLTGWEASHPYLELVRRHSGTLGLDDYMPVTELNLGSVAHVDGHARTCSDSRFCQPSVPVNTVRVLPDESYVQARWPVCAHFDSAHKYVDSAWKDEFGKDHETFISTATDASVARADFEAGGGQIVALGSTAVVVLPGLTR